jgi:hypothetical protein
MPRFRSKRRKDGSRYSYPITPKRRPSRAPPFRIMRPIQQGIAGESLLDNALRSILYKTPIIRELRSVYIVADSVYNNWNLIKELSERYRQEGLVGVIDSKAGHRTLTSVQTKIIWKVIKGVIPKRLHDQSLDTLSTVVNKITDEEIKYVKKFLQEND